MSSHGSCVDLVVLAMSAYKADVCDLPVVVHCHHQPIVVSLDVKNDAITC